MFDATLLAYRQHLEVRRSADCRGAGWQEFHDIVHGVVRELRGSISAE